MGEKNFLNGVFGLLFRIPDFCKAHWKLLTIVIVALFLLIKIGSTVFMAKMQIIMQSQPKPVEVTEIKEQEVQKSFEFSGRVEAKYSVDLIARVQGFLQKAYFKEGDFVKKGQVLFLIEPNQYQIAVKNAQAALNATKASLTNAEKNLVRARELVKQDFVSKSYYDDALAQRDLYRGNLDVNKAQLAQAKLDLSYTKITAPVDGKIGKILITQGNLVNLSKGTIAKLISTNPIYVSFTLKSEDYLKFKKADSTQDVSNTIVSVKLSDKSEYKEKGKVEFIDNQIDSTAGTITMRATFNNPDGLLLPSDFVTVTLTPINPRHEILVPMEAVQDSTDGFFVYVVTNEGNENEKGSVFGGFMQKIDNKINNFVLKYLVRTPIDKEAKIVKVRHIKATEQYKNHWIIDEGLNDGDIVVVQGITQLKDGMRVKIVKKD